MPEFIPYGRQSVTEDDILTVVEALKSDWLTQGPIIEQFEKAVAEYCDAKYAVAVNSGTSALHIACLAADFGHGDILWTSPNTFVASSNCGLYCGGKVDFVDIDADTYNISVNALEMKLESAHKVNKLPKIVIPVHFAGQSCQMDKISELAKHYDFTVIEDASHAFGGRYRGIKIGKCIFSEMTVFSFHPVKIFTTGEGGMVLTNKKEYYEKLIRLRSHGITRNPELMEGKSHGPWYYQQIELGFNYRMTDFQAALGTSQIKRVDDFVKKRHLLANRYNSLLKTLPLVLPWQDPEVVSAYHLYVVKLKLNKIKKTYLQVFEELRAKGIGVNLHYIPVHTQPYYKKLGFSLGDFKEAERYYQEAMSLPIYPGLNERQQDLVINALSNSLFS
jgi:UDP-4-amino-4,6-dideoxy-N-acetyl-beta-L-altrosamine transaminase